MSGEVCKREILETPKHQNLFFLWLHRKRAGTLPLLVSTVMTVTGVTAAGKETRVSRVL